MRAFMSFVLTVDAMDIRMRRAKKNQKPRLCRIRRLCLLIPSSKVRRSLSVARRLKRILGLGCKLRKIGASTNR
ncbi:hypothetical protein LINPERHAP2_LOCUS26074 [Linum perenne]